MPSGTFNLDASFQLPAIVTPTDACGTALPRWIMDGLIIAETTAVPILTAAFSIAKSIRAIMGLKLEQIGIAAGQDQLLVYLDVDTQKAVRDVAAALRVRPSTVSKMTDRMVERGLVERTGSPEDARRTFLCLTPLGKHVQGQVVEIWMEIEADLRKRLGAETDAAIGQMALIDVALGGYLSRLR